MIATQTSFRALVALVSTAILGLSATSGCGGGGRNCHACGPGGGYFGLPATICFGYSSTCWHAWPTECTACPAYNFPPQVNEPLPAKALPPSAIEPAFEAPPAPEPSPSDQSPAEENKQSRRSPPPVLIVDPVAAAARQDSAIAADLPVATEAARHQAPETVPVTEPEAPDVSSAPTAVKARPEPLIAAAVPLEQVVSPALPLTKSESPATYGAAEPASEPLPQPTATKQPRFQLPALLNLVHSPPPPKRQKKSAVAPKATPAVPGKEVNKEPTSPYGPPPPVLVEPPSSPAEPAPAVQVTNYQPAHLPRPGAPAMIINTSVEPSHQPPPPVLIGPEAADNSFMKASVEASLSDSQIAPTSAPLQPDARPSHIISDWRLAESELPPVVNLPRPTESFQPQGELRAPVEEERLAPIVSPASALRRLPPVRDR
jgi:hypothetical protein